MVRTCWKISTIPFFSHLNKVPANFTGNRYLSLLLLWQYHQIHRPPERGEFFQLTKQKTSKESVQQNGKIKGPHPTAAVYHGLWSSFSILSKLSKKDKSTIPTISSIPRLSGTCAYSLSGHLVLPLYLAIWSSYLSGHLVLRFVAWFKYKKYLCNKRRSCQMS